LLELAESLADPRMGLEDRGRLEPGWVSLAKPAALRCGQYVDAEADSKKLMIDCGEMARAISKHGSGLRAIAAEICIYACVLLFLWCEPRWGERLLLATAQLIPGT
jgi:hypothetical protein